MPLNQDFKAHWELEIKRYFLGYTSSIKKACYHSSYDMIFRRGGGGGGGGGVVLMAWQGGGCRRPLLSKAATTVLDQVLNWIETTL